MDAAVQNPTRAPSRLRKTAPWLTLAGAALVAVGYGLLALANLDIAAIYRSGLLGDIAGAYQIGAAGDALVGVGLLLAIAGLATMVRR